MLNQSTYIGMIDLFQIFHFITKLLCKDTEQKVLVDTFDDIKDFGGNLTDPIVKNRVPLGLM
jgi:hypothetical protein